MPDQTSDTPERSILLQLTPRKRKFLELIAREGLTVVEAYRAAGYTGKSHAAYQLFHDSKKQFAAIMKLDGIEKETLLNKVRRLVDERLASQEQGITISQKLRSIELLARLIEREEPPQKPVITPFIVERSDSHLKEKDNGFTK